MSRLSIRPFAIVMLLLLVMAACGGNEGAADVEATSDAAGEDATDAGATDATAEPNAEAGDAGSEGESEYAYENGVLQPMEDGFPDRPLTFANLFEVGDASDIYLRAMAEAAEGISPVPIEVVQQRQGPDLAWGFLRWAETQPGGTEGYYMTEASFSSYPIRYLQVELGPGHHYDRINPVILNSVQNFALGVPADSEFETMEDLLAFAEENPGELRVAVMIASQLQFALIMLAEEAGIEIQQIPAANPVESVTTMLGGGADAVMTTPEPLLAQAEAGEASVLLQIGDEPTPSMADVPTSAEFGWTIPLGSQRGLATHPEVPDERRAWLFELFKTASEEPSFKEYLENVGGAPTLMRPEEVQAMMDDVHDRVLPIMEELDLVVEGND